MHKLVPGTLIAVSLSTDKYDEYYEGDFVSVIGDKNDPNTALAMIAANRGFFIGRTKETEKELRDIPHFVSKEELCRALWGSAEYVDENILQVNISRLRKKLAESGFSPVLENIRGKGYALRTGE